MRIYWVLFGIFSVYAAIVNSMWVDKTNAVESLTRVKRADEKLTNIDSGTATHSDSETKSIKQEKDIPVKHEKEHHIKEHHSKPNTPSKLHETLTTTTLPILMTTSTTTTTPIVATSTHKPIDKNPTHEKSKPPVHTVQEHPQVPQNSYQIVPSTMTDKHFGPPLPIHNPGQFTPMDEPPQQNSYVYRESNIPFARSAYEDYNLGSTYQAASSYHQIAPTYQQSNPVAYAQPTVYSQQSEYQPPCGSSVLISCQPSVQQSPCSSSYQPSYYVPAPYHVDIPSFHPQTNYQPQQQPLYREAERNGMFVEEPLLGRTHHHRHHQHHHHRPNHVNNYKTTEPTEVPEKIDLTEDSDRKKHNETAIQINSTEPIKQIEKNDTEKPDKVKHLKVPTKQETNDKEDTMIGAPLTDTTTIDKSTTHEPSLEPSQEMRQTQSFDMSKQDPMQTDEMPSSIMQGIQQMSPQIPSDPMPSSMFRNDQQTDSSQMPSSIIQSDQQMHPQISSDQMQRQQMMQNEQMVPQMMPQMMPQMIPQQMMNMHANMPVNPLTLDPMLINPVNMQPVHEFHRPSSDGPFLSMRHPMMEEVASQSAGGSPQQMFWEPTGLYYQVI